MGTLANIKIEPMVATWGEDVSMVETITCVADSSSSLNNKYFFFYTPAGAKHYIWIDVASAGTDPSIAGATAHEVDISEDATASAVATAVEAVIEAVTGFASEVSGAVITVTHETAGYCQAAHDGNSGFSFAVTTDGDAEADLGFVDGDIELAISENLADITAHEHGSNVLSQIRTGKVVEVTINLKETSVAQLKRLFVQGSGSFTPTGVGGTEVSGWGTQKDFTQTINEAKKLVLHPKVLGSGDLSRDFTFHLAYPMLESLNFSGENILMVPVTFKVYPKLTLNNRVEYFSFGDGSQTLT